MPFDFHSNPELESELLAVLESDFSLEEDEKEERELQEMKRLEALKAEDDDWDE